MKIQPKNSVVPKILIGMAFVAVLLGGYLAYASFTDTWPFSKPEPAEEKSDKNSAADKPISTSSKTDEDDPTANTPAEFTPPKDSEKPKQNELTGIVNYKGVVDNNLTIRTTINQLLNSGECHLKLTSESGKVIEETTSITASPSTSTCDGFSVSTSKLSPGKWNINITLTSGDKQGELKSTVTI